MPFSSLAGVGFEAHGGIIPRQQRHPHPVRPMLETPDPVPPSDSVPPVLPDQQPPAQVPFDEYASGPPLHHGKGARLEAVKLEHPRVLLHPGWKATAIGPALYPPTPEELQAGKSSRRLGLTPVALDINHVTASMFANLAPVTRRSLMGILGNVQTRVSWRDPLCDRRMRKKKWGVPIGKLQHVFGRNYTRRRILGLKIGHHYCVNAATGLAMRMAALPKHKPFIQTMAAGLIWTAPALRARRCTELFGACDTAKILAEVLAPLPQASPKEACDLMDAASSLIQRYCEEVCNDSADTIRKAFEDLIKGLVPLLPHDADHIGMCIGAILAGVAKFGGAISASDNHRRWWIASTVNLIWAATSFAPFFFIAGPIAFGVVAAGVTYDRLTPVRDYSTLMGRFEAELTQTLLGQRIDWLPNRDVARLMSRIRQVLKASDIPC